MNEENIEGKKETYATGVTYGQALAYQEQLKRMPSTNDWVDPDILEAEQNILRKKLMFFGTDLAEIPCFRNSFLYGMLSGFGSGISYFAFTSNIRKAQPFGFYTFVLVTFGYYCHCSWDYSTSKFRYKQIEYALQQHAIYDGTDKSMKNMLKRGELKDDDE